MPGDAVVRLAVRRRDAQPVAVGQRDQDEPRVDELAQAAARRAPSSGSSSSSDGERVADLVERLELAQPARRRLVEPRVLDRDGGLRGEQLRQLLVLVGEVDAALPSR